MPDRLHDAEQTSDAGRHRNKRIAQRMDEDRATPTQPLGERGPDIVGAHVLHQAVLHQHGVNRKGADQIGDQRQDRVPGNVRRL